MKISSKIGLLLSLLIPACAYANQAATGYCTVGGVKVVTSGLNSTNSVMGSFPGCTVSVFVHGGGLATIFSDNSGTPLANPFTANAITGAWIWYAANGRYDVQLTATGLSTTISDILLNDPAAAGSTFTGSTVTSSTANPATSGFIRMAATDTICWRNNANGGNVCLARSGVGDTLTWPSSLTLTGGLTATTGTFSIINSTSGYQVNGAAASANYLRGDGTNFVASLIQSTDLTTPLSTPPPIGSTTPNTGKFTSVCYHTVNDVAVVTVSASCGFTTWAAALAACPSTGCILDGTAPDVPLALGTFDTGSNTKPVTVRLGPYTYTFSQIVVRQGLDLGGAGILSTNLQNTGSNANPAFVIPQVNNNIITVKIHDFTVLALAGNTSQDGLFSDCSTLTNAGLQFSEFKNLIFNGFNGSAYHLKATQDGISGSIGCNQFDNFTNVQATRPAGAVGATQNALRIEGGNGQIEFWNCLFTGSSNDTGQNVFVGTSGLQQPYSIHFHGVTVQNGFAYLCDGCGATTVDYGHYEQIKGIYNFATTGQLVDGFVASHDFIGGGAAQNAGNGYVLNVPVGVTNADIAIDDEAFGVVPDKCVVRSASGATVVSRNFQYINNATPVNVCPGSGMTFPVTPAATIDAKTFRSVQLSASATSITTIKSGLQPGEMITFYSTGGTAQFATGGNLSFGTQPSPLILQSGDSATFVRVDAGTPSFVLVGQSGMVKTQRFGASCTTGAAVGAACNTAVTWASAFPDANYTVNCTVTGATSGEPIVINVNTKAGAGMNISIAALTAVAAQASSVDCIARHD